MMERYHRTLTQMLGKVVSESQRHWDLHVSAAAAAYGASEHVVTGFTPNFMMLGRKVPALVNIILGAPASEEEFWTSLSPMHSRDTGRHTLLLRRISVRKRVGGRMSTTVKL